MNRNFAGDFSAEVGIFHPIAAGRNPVDWAEGFVTPPKNKNITIA